MVCNQLTTFLEGNNMLPRHQSGFRARHSTERAVLKIMSDILSSFLCERTQEVIFKNLESTVTEVTAGVPQGSGLGPLLFLLYTADISVIAMEYNLGVHCYADDGQLYVFDKADGADSLVSRVNACIAENDVWMSSNRLKLNSEKTQFIWLGGRQQLNKVNINSINLLRSTINYKSSVINLGVTIDGPLTMKGHVLRICHTSFYQLRQLRVIRGSRSIETCTALVHAFVSTIGWTTATACLKE